MKLNLKKKVEERNIINSKIFMKEKENTQENMTNSIQILSQKISKKKQ